MSLFDSHCSRPALLKQVLSAAAVIAAALFIPPAPVMAQQENNWANWRGPEQNGISRETGLPDDWSLESNKAWESDIGGRATPIILNGRVFLNCRTPDDFTDRDEMIHSREQVVCWDLKSGDVLWQDAFNVFLTDIPSPRVGWASMCGDEETGNVFMHSVSGMFRCYTPDGEVVWEHSLFEEYGKISGYGGRTQTPIIDEDRVIVSFLAVNWGDMKGPAPLHYYYAFDKKTGELQWVSAPGGAPQDTNYSVPIVAVINGQRLLIGGNSDGSICAMNARTGQPVWQFRMSKRGLNSSPVVDGNNVYIAHGEDNIDNVTFGRVQCIDGSLTGDITDKGSVWRHDGLKAGYTALLIKDGVLYVVSDPGNLHAFESATGEEHWEHNLGTVGKGSPVWADGKMYLTEVNGNVLILEADRTGCTELSRVQLNGTTVEGLDEIYASPAISQGHVVFVTCNRTICVTDKTGEWQPGEIPAMAAETDPGTEPALIQLRPYEVTLKAGESAGFELHKFDANGRFLGKEAAALTAEGDLAAMVDGATVAAPADTGAVAGNVVAKLGELEATARIRTFNTSQPWAWDFEGMAGIQVPPTWVRAHIKMKPVESGEGNTAMQLVGMGKGKGRPSHIVLLGTADMKDYEIQADVLMKEQNRQLPRIGLINGRYTFVMNGNASKLQIVTWPAHLRLGSKEKFVSDPDIWYTMKMRVDVTETEAVIFGKVWPRDEQEPAEWSIQATDPHPNPSGSPGLYVYAQADCRFDNVKVEFAEPAGADR